MPGRTRYRSALITALALVSSFGCGSDPSPSAPGAAAAESPIAVAVVPGNAVPTADPEFPFAAGFTVQVFGTSDLALQIREIVIALDNQVIYTREQILLAAGSATVPPHGSLEIPLAIGLTQNGVTAELIVRATDEGGNVYEALGRLVIVPAQGP